MRFDKLIVILAVGQVVAFFEVLILDGGDANDGKKVIGVKNTPALVGRGSLEVGIGDILFTTGNRGTRSCVAADFAKGCMLIKTGIVVWRQLRAISGWRVSWAESDSSGWFRSDVAVASNSRSWGGRAVGGRSRGWRAVQAHRWGNNVEIGVKKLKAKVGSIATTAAPAATTATTAAWRLTAAAGDLVEIRI